MTGVADGVVDADQTVNIVFDPTSADVDYNALVNGVVFAGNENIDVANVAPTADAGGPYTGQVSASITLSAAGSIDSDGTIASYAWDLDNDGQYDDATGATASYTVATAGTSTVGVQVTDDDGAMGADTATVTGTDAATTPVVFINELMADNDATIEDPDEAGAFEDWVELYNPGTASADLSGLYLTDDTSEPTQ